MINYKKKFELFRRSKHFCSAPWNLLYVSTNGDVHTCTRGARIDNLSNNNIETILTNQQFHDIRSGIIQDQVVNNCKGCLALENQGDGSKNYQFLRNMYNELFVDQELDYENTQGFQLGAVDLHWSSICDLKCVTCWSKQSSSIAVEQGVPVQHTKTEIANQLIKYIVQNQSTLKEVYFSGGEPSLIKYNLTLLQQLEKRSDLLIRINSNMMWDQDNRIIAEVLKFPRVMFTCSADNTGEKFEYIRRGASWTKFINNLNYLKNFSNVEIRVNSVFFVLSAVDLHHTVDYFTQEHNITNFTINQCGMGHNYLRCRNLSDSVKLVVTQNLSQAKERYKSNLNFVGSLNNCLTEISQPSTESYVDYFNHIDSLAGTSWRRLFPELT